MKMNISLLSGAGNTFHIVHQTSEQELRTSHEKKRNIAKEICFKKPADGFIFLQQNEEGLSWTFFNNDGSDAEMCGNATRCVGYFMKNILKDSKSEWKLKTVAGLIKISYLEKEKFRVVMTEVKEQPSSLGFYCNTGVPHLVLETASIAEAPSLRLVARQLRNHKQFYPAGTNVTYVQKTARPNQVKAISYERGVEDFTAACGTGALAAAYYNYRKNEVLETTVEMPGGMLIMNLANLNHPTMVGPANLLESYDYEI